MNSWKNRVLSFVVGIILAVVGFFIIANPDEALVSLILVIGVFLLISGFVAVIDSIRIPAFIPGKSLLMVEGIMQMIIGGLFSFGNQFIASAVLGYLLVFTMIISSIVHISFVSAISRGGMAIFSIILNIITIGLGVYILFNPILASGVLITAVGFQFIIAGIERMVITFIPTDSIK